MFYIHVPDSDSRAALGKESIIGVKKTDNEIEANDMFITVRYRYLVCGRSNELSTCIGDSVVDPYPDWIRIQGGPLIRIRIRW